MSDPALLPVNDAFLLLNPGNASLKSAIFEDDAGLPGQSPVWRASVTGIGKADCYWRDSEGGEALLPADDDPFLAAFSYLLARALAWLGDQPVRAIGYRLPHAGNHPGQPALLDDAILDFLDSVPAPRFQKETLRIARMLAARWPGVPQVVSFDSWFHRSLSPAERMLPLPPRFWEAGLRRNGCHGLSYEFLATALPRRSALQDYRGRAVLGDTAVSSATQAGALPAGDRATALLRRLAELDDSGGPGRKRRGNVPKTACATR